MTAVRKYI